MTCDEAWERRFIEQEIVAAGRRYEALAAEYHWWRKRALSLENEANLLRDAEWKRHFLARENRALRRALGLNGDNVGL